MFRSTLLAMTATAAFATAAYAEDATMDIVDTAVANGSFTTLVAAVQAAGLVDTLKSEGPFTVFAPTDAAFAALPAGAVDSLLMPENLATLQQILTCHVIPASVQCGEIRGMIRADGGEHPFTTVGGCQFTALESDGVLMIRDGQGNLANITIADVYQSNGMIHVIDAVLLPAG